MVAKDTALLSRTDFFLIESMYLCLMHQPFHLLQGLRLMASVFLHMPSHALLLQSV